MISLNAASTVVDLAPDRARDAIALSQAIPNPLTRWQSYLVLLALEGFVQWISDRSTPIRLDRSQARLLEPSAFGIPAAINRVFANQFQIGLLVVEEDVENEIEFPTSLLNNPAHFYIATCVDEESHQVSFHSFLRGDYLNSMATTEATCTIPVSQFETNLEQLLWYLASLELSAISLPSASPAVSPQWLVQPLVNAAQWLQSQLDELAWTLFTPELTPAAGMRSRANAFSADLASVFTEIERAGIYIPSTAQSAYRPITLNQRTFRLYLTTWAMEETSEPEWSLLAILESIQTPTLPASTRLMIQSDETILIEEEAKAQSAYLIAQVIGSWSERFTLALKSFDPESGTLQDSLSLPPVVFQPY